MAAIRTWRSPGKVLWHVSLASVLLLIGLVAGPAIRSAFATHAGDQTIHACVSRFTGQARIILPGQPPNCTANEVSVSWNSASGAAPAVEVSEQLQVFNIPAGLTFTQNVSCPNAGEVPISGGGFADDPADIPLLIISQSFRRFDDSWRVSMTNLDENASHDAVAQVLCVPAS